MPVVMKALLLLGVDAKLHLVNPNHSTCRKSKQEFADHITSIHAATYLPDLCVSLKTIRSLHFYFYTMHAFLFFVSIIRTILVCKT